MLAPPPFLAPRLKHTEKEISHISSLFSSSSSPGETLTKMKEIPTTEERRRSQRRKMMFTLERYNIWGGGKGAAHPRGSQRHQARAKVSSTISTRVFYLPHLFIIAHAFFARKPSLSIHNSTSRKLILAHYCAQIFDQMGRIIAAIVIPYHHPATAEGEGKKKRVFRLACGWVIMVRAYGTDIHSMYYCRQIAPTDLHDNGSCEKREEKRGKSTNGHPTGPLSEGESRKNRNLLLLRPLRPIWAGTFTVTGGAVN